MRLIDADELLKKWLEQKDPELICPTMEAFYENIICQTLDAISDAPTIDAVEVVRCKDCKLYGVSKFYISAGDNITQLRFCVKTGRPTGIDDYCSYGERK